MINADIEIILALVLLVGTLISFILEKVSVDMTAITLLGIILFLSSLSFSENWPKLTEIISVFSNQAPLTIACMFIISAALNKCGIVEEATSYLSKFCIHGYKKFMVIFLLLVAIFSAFVNNTPIVVMLLPVVMSLSRKLGVSSSKMLIPVSYASIFGGCCTLVGTSTNLLASGIMSTSQIYPHMETMSMFELSKIGLPLMFLSLGFLVIFGKKLLPEREALTNIISSIERKEFLTEAVVLQSSPLIGRKLSDTGIENLSGTRLLNLLRKGKSLPFNQNDLVLESGDRLVLSCKPQGIVEAREMEGIDLFNDSKLGIEKVSSEAAVMVEALVGPSSNLISMNLSDAQLRSGYNLTILALHRRGRNLKTRLNKVNLRSGDTLLVLTPESSLERLRNSEEVILLDSPPQPAKNMKTKAPIVIMILFCVVSLAAIRILPILVASLIGVALLFLTGCIRPREAYRSIEWNIIVLIFGMLALGVTMEKTGASVLIASFVGKIGMEMIPREFQIIAVLLILYLLTSCLTEVLSNNATIVVMAPISLEIANQMNMAAADARAYVLTVCISASASFITPIGYQTNTLVYNVGGYKFGDFMRIGIFFNLIYCVGTLGLVSWYWNFWSWE